MARGLISSDSGREPGPPRRTCGYYLANMGYDLRLIQDYLDHRDPRHTVHYAQTAASRFDGLWRR
jgi:type 1 fimbriae regulatory protein FimB